jgi:hypothetical protein
MRVREKMAKYDDMTTEDKEYLAYPDDATIKFACDFVASNPQVAHKFLDASMDCEGGLLLDFEGKLCIGISHCQTFFPSRNNEVIKRYYTKTQLNELLADYFSTTRP